VLAQGGLERLPALVITEFVEQAGQPVIAKIETPDLLSQPLVQASQMAFDPGLDVIKTVISLGEKMGQPANTHLTRTKPLPVRMGRKVLIYKLGHLHSLKLSQQEWYIIHSFGFNHKVFGHLDSLA
jgi:hypothetical protein